jgi:hypothetical protein
MTIKLSYLLLGTAVSLARRTGCQRGHPGRHLHHQKQQYRTIQSAVNAAQTNDKV